MNIKNRKCSQGDTGSKGTEDKDKREPVILEQCMKNSVQQGSLSGSKRACFAFVTCNFLLTFRSALHQEPPETSLPHMRLSAPALSAMAAGLIITICLATVGGKCSKVKEVHTGYFQVIQHKRKRCLKTVHSQQPTFNVFTATVRLYFFQTPT